MAVVKVVPAKSESAVVESHDENGFPLQVVSLMMRRKCFKRSRCVDGGSR